MTGVIDLQDHGNGTPAADEVSDHSVRMLLRSCKVWMETYYNLRYKWSILNAQGTETLIHIGIWENYPFP